jgi:hypothetical protein
MMISQFGDKASTPDRAASTRVCFLFVQQKCLANINLDKYPNAVLKLYQSYPYEKGVF